MWQVFWFTSFNWNRHDRFSFKFEAEQTHRSSQWDHTTNSYYWNTRVYFQKKLIGICLIIDKRQKIFPCLKNFIHMYFYQNYVPPLNCAKGIECYVSYMFNSFIIVKTVYSVNFFTNLADKFSFTWQRRMIDTPKDIWITFSSTCQKKTLRMFFYEPGSSCLRYDFGKVSGLMYYTHCNSLVYLLEWEILCSNNYSDIKFYIHNFLLL